MSDASMDKAAIEAAQPPGPTFVEDVIDAAGVAVGQVEKVVGWPIYQVRFYRAAVDERLVRGAWPGSSELASLDALGIQCVVNLCAERRQDAAVTAAGMVPANIPVADNTVPPAGAAEAFLSLLTAFRRVFVHCEMGAGRTGCFVAFYRVRRCGWTPAAALEEATRYGLAMPSQRAWILSLTPEAT